MPIDPQAQAAAAGRCTTLARPPHGHATPRHRAGAAANVIQVEGKILERLLQLFGAGRADDAPARRE